MALLTSELLPTKTYPFSVLRHQSARDPSQEGVWGATDYQVVQRGAGANMSVDVGAGDAWVQGDDAVRQGLYHQINDATVNVTVGTAHATLPRIDQVVLQMADSSVLGASDTPALNVVAGTATSGATLDNRTGAGALPNTALRLADILVPAAATSIVTANIRDRRPWARGALYRSLKTNSNASTTSTTMVSADTTLLQARIECSGVPVRVMLNATGQNGTAGDGIATGLQVDGAAVDGVTTLSQAQQGGTTAFVGYSYVTVPSPGSHLLTVTFEAIAGGVATLNAGTGFPAELLIAEEPRQNTNNGTA